MQLRYVTSELRQGLRRNMSMHLAVILTLFVSLTLVGLGLLLNGQTKKTEEHYGSEIQITVFLCNKTSTSPNCTGDVTPAQEAAIIEVIKENPQVAGYHTESQETALRKAKELYGEEYLRHMKAEALRKSVWIELKDAQEFEGIVSAVTGLDGVSSVRDQRDLLDRLFGTLEALRIGSWAIAAFLILAALMLVANTIRLAAFARRREIGIMRLVGASTLYIALPFLLEAVVTAVVGVALAGGTLALFLVFVVRDRLTDLIAFLPWIGWEEYVSALGWIALLGLLLTVIPTLVLTRKYLKV